MIEEKLKELGIEIPEAPAPLASYIPAIVVGNLVYTAGQVPLENGKLRSAGLVGREINTSDAQEAAKICAINCLGAIKKVIGDMNKIKRIVKLTVFVASEDGFIDQPKVANGASDLLVKLFGENGKHVRSAVGVMSLPLNAPVEIEMIAELNQ